MWWWLEKERVDALSCDIDSTSRISVRVGSDIAVHRKSSGPHSSDYYSDWITLVQDWILIIFISDRSSSYWPLTRANVIFIFEPTFFVLSCFHSKRATDDGASLLSAASNSHVTRLRNRNHFLMMLDAAGGHEGNERQLLWKSGKKAKSGTLCFFN